MMRLLLTAFLLIGTLGASAQNTEYFRRGLAMPDSVYGARVTVVEKGLAEALVQKLSTPAPERKIQGHRVCIFVDSSQKALDNANAAAEKFRELFPDIPVYKRYDTPDWKVLVGNCMTIEEMTILKGRVEKFFPSAFPSDEVIVLSEFGK